ncbi:MAG: rhomboid family intramembrane serine protease [Pontiellaceae bacterium]|nr:rhomboid family intramembrane serine protease [Pontiellaceae bacterium]MBN2786090.1 rhomboid family intramembrane serine protease [Pontiellaceae bacterium]
MNDTLAIGTAAVLVITAVLTYLGFRNPSLVDRWLFSSYGILRRKEFYRLFSSGFIHADWGHLFFNLFSLYSFGNYIEQIFGLHTFLAIYFVSMLGGNLFALYLHRNHEYRALGASGGVCGVIFASTFLLPGSSVYIMFIPIPVPAWLYAIIFMFISARGIQSQRSSIGHEAHLGGAIAGLLVTTVLQPGIIAANPLLYAVIMVLAVGFGIYITKRPQN